MIDRKVPRIIALEQSVAEIFSDAYRLVLPYFQRGYAWKPEHAVRLLTDVLSFAERQTDIDWYPLGAIIVAKSPDSPEAWVADGHQRLITLTILIALLRDRETDAAIKERLSACIFEITQRSDIGYRLTTHDAARECLQRYVQTNGSTWLPYQDEGEDLSESERNIIANRDSLRTEILKLPDERRRALADYLLDCCLVLVKCVREQRVAQFLFSTMHDAGLKPTNVDLFKAQILGRVRVPGRESCQTAWESLEARIGQSGFETLLKHIAELALRESPKAAVTGILHDHFNLDNPTETEAFVDDTLRRLGRIYAHALEAPHRPVPFTPSICRRLQYLSWVRNHDTWMVPAIHWIDSKGIDHADTEEFLRRLEVLAWTQMICTIEPPQRHQRYMQVLKEIDDGSVLSLKSAMTVSREEQKKIRKTLSGANYTNRSYKLFLLLRANAAIEGDVAISPLPEATIEHIYPRNPTTSSRWIIDFANPKEASQLRNSIGNLTLLTRAEQDRTKNYDFEIKQPVLASSVFALSRRLAARKTWRVDDVTENSSEVIDLLMKCWQLE